MTLIVTYAMFSCAVTVIWTASVSSLSQNLSWWFSLAVSFSWMLMLDVWFDLLMMCFCGVFLHGDVGRSGFWWLGEYYDHRFAPDVLVFLVGFIFVPTFFDELIARCCSSFPLECLNNLTLDPACVLGKHVEAHYHYWALNNVERTSLPLDSIISKYCLLLHGVVMNQYSQLLIQNGMYWRKIINSKAMH
jgi:hypothetical protein